MKSDYDLAVIASTQGGYLGHGQLQEHGLSEKAIEQRVHNGALIRVRKGLFKVDGIDGDYKGLLRGAMAILPEPTISHESAAELHAIPYIQRRKAVVTVHARTTHTFPGVQIHRSLDLLPEHRQKIDSLWITNPARTLVDAAAVLHPKALRSAVEDSLARKLVLYEELEKIFLQVARKGRTGAGEMRKLLGYLAGTDMKTASQLEHLGMRVFENGGLPLPVWQYPAPWNPDHRIDFAWPHVCVGCECDSRRWHTRVSDFQRDRDRDNLSLIHNWRIFRFTWDDFANRPEYVVEQLRMAIEG